MDVVALFKTLMRHKFVVAGVALATMAAIGYVLLAVPPVYEQTSSVVLLPARSQPSESALEESPELASVDPFNPFSGDPSLLVTVVANRLNSDESRDGFERRGLDPNYEVEAALNYGAIRPEMVITAFGESPEQTIQTRTALTEAVQRQLVAAQAEQNVAPYFMVRTLPVAPGSAPQEKTSTKLRSVVALGAVGAIALFAVTSLLTALDEHRGGGPNRRRRSRRAKRGGSRIDSSSSGDSSVGGSITDEGIPVESTERDQRTREGRSEGDLYGQLTSEAPDEGPRALEPVPGPQ